MNGEQETGVTIMKMEKGLDTGDMIYKVSTPINPEDTAGTVFDRLAELGADALIKAIDQIVSGSAVYEKQDDAK